MKKIGLAVCYDTKNFGSQLQVLATVKKIENLGFNTEIIRYKKKLTPQFIGQTIPRLFNISFLKAKFGAKKKVRQIKKIPEIAQQVNVRNKRFEGFVKDYLTNLSPIYKGWENLVKESAKNYDLFLCGSDQLWLPNNLGSHFYTLEFAPEQKVKIAYATSFGVSQIPWFQKAKTKNYLQRFQSISTREHTGKSIIKDLTGLDVPVVCDPTLLFSEKEWLEQIPEKKLIHEPYIFCYFLGTNPEHRIQANELKKLKNLEIVTIPFLDNFVKEDMKFGDIKLFDIDSSDFINLIRNAEYILTDSFHGSVFSILNHKKFMVFNRFNAGANSRNSRIDSLCKNLDLADRRYHGNVLDVDLDIDYENVDKKLKDLRDNSIVYLEKSLKEAFSNETKY